jgi:hypothetical protein
VYVTLNTIDGVAGSVELWFSELAAPKSGVEAIPNLASGSKTVEFVYWLTCMG